jgi:hypothetical protein
MLTILALGAGWYFFSLRLAHPLVRDPRGGPPRLCMYGSSGCNGYNPSPWVPAVAVVFVGLGLSATGVLRRHERVIARAEDTTLGGRPLTRRSW